MGNLHIDQLVSYLHTQTSYAWVMPCYYSQRTYTFLPEHESEQLLSVSRPAREFNPRHALLMSSIFMLAFVKSWSHCAFNSILWPMSVFMRHISCFSLNSDFLHAILSLINEFANTQ